MALRDEIREQQSKLKGQGFRKKLEYFWDYYKLPVIIVLVLVALSIGIFREMQANKPSGFYALFLNAENADADKLGEMTADWYESLDIDPEKQSITVDASLRFDPEAYNELSIGGITRVSALLASKSVDCMVTDPKLFQYYAESGAFLDLRTLYTEEELRSLEGRLCYLDAAKMTGEAGAESEEAEPESSEIEGNKEPDTEESIRKYLALSPEGMENPAPVGILYRGEGKLAELGLYPELSVFSIISNSERAELAKKVQERI